MMQPEPEAADSRPSSTRLREAIGQCIVSGEFPPGSRLTEADLAQRFGVNRAPLREALFRLEERRLIEREPFSGMRVALLTSPMLDELYEIREALEGVACRRAARVITAAQVAEMKHALAERRHAYRAGVPEEQRTPPVILDVHRRIAEISGNAELARLLNGEIWHYMRAMYRRWARPPERTMAALDEHERIVDALGAHDPELAELLMRRHVASSRQALASARTAAEGDAG